MSRVITGLESLLSSPIWQQRLRGRQVALCCHNASITSDYRFAVTELLALTGPAHLRLLGPQHGLFGDLQDNMIESAHCLHPYFKIPVFSLYSQTRTPTDEMLEGVQTIVVDLQDVGTRVYTYISTLSLMMEKIAGRDIELIVLDRPNPAGGVVIEGNLTEPEFTSFVGRYPMPMRHGLTIGEFALWVNRYFLKGAVQLQVVPLQGWERAQTFSQTGLPWVQPSPNLSHADSALVYPGTVLFEGAMISEGRGSTRALEILGHPQLEPYAFCKRATQELQALGEHGFVLRPCYFMPTFHKFAGQTCGAFQIHPIEPTQLHSWRVGQYLMGRLWQELYFEWKQPPYEYEYQKLPIDVINGCSKIRLWVERGGDFAQLLQLEQQGHAHYRDTIDSILLYR